jgi:hypothetical protein
MPETGRITETEPEIEPGPEEMPEAELEMLEEPEAGLTTSPTAAAAPTGPAAGTAPEHGPLEHGASTDGEAGAGPSPENTARSSDDVRRELRSYLDGVRDRLDRPGAQTSPGDLLDYLGKLSDYLPDREKKRFRGSNERLAMESLKARLAGRRGLREKVAERFPPTAPRRAAAMTRSRMVDTFSYLRDLAAWHPDKAVAEAMREKIESIVSRMGRLR